jgi:hypothetical protein
MSGRFERQGLRMAETAWVDFEIPKLSNQRSLMSTDQAFGFGLLGFVLLGLVGMWFFWVRPLRRL